MAIVAGHHDLQKGKLVLLDPKKGDQGTQGMTFLNPKIAGWKGPDREKCSERFLPDGSGLQSAEIPSVPNHGPEWDFFGQTGPQFQYPYPLDARNFVVSFTQTGCQGGGCFEPPSIQDRFEPRFGIYWMNLNGERELLAYDPATHCSQMIPVIPRRRPMARGSVVESEARTGFFYVQNLYFGPGLAGVAPGTIQKLRVVGLEFRAGHCGSNRNGGEAGGACVQTPIGTNNCCWDVKHVLGEADVEADGSVCFECPVRTPVYFQLLDAQGRTVQTMRSWATLQPGERFACLGCHESKAHAGETSPQTTLAMKRPPQLLKPMPGTPPHPLVTEARNAGASQTLDAFMGLQKTRTLEPDAPVDGFSYRRIIQPILDRHCVSCHGGDEANPKRDAQGRFNLTAERIDPTDQQYARRAFTRSYQTLTHGGKMTQMVNWFHPQGRPQMLPPYSAGSTQSQIMNYLESSHYGVQVSDSEKRLFACWIDLGVPFCGSYPEANLWTDAQKKGYEAYQKKRAHFAAEELP